MNDANRGENINLDISVQAEDARKFKSLVKKVVSVNFITFGISLANEVLIQHTPVGFSQVAMEGVDGVLPLALNKANQADHKKAAKRAIGWRSATNLAHIAAGTAGVIEASNFLGEDMSYDARGIAISGLIGLWNLGLLSSIRQRRRDRNLGIHEVVELTPESVAMPESVKDVLKESHHKHPDYSGRNLENLEMCARSNIVEALPPLLGPIAQMGWENGSASMVIASNAAVVAMAGWQQIKDIRIMNSLHNSPA